MARLLHPMISSHARWRAGVLCASIGIAFATGCSNRPKIAPASGTPVKMGKIETRSNNHVYQSTATIGPDGRFSLSTFVPGDREPTVGAVVGTQQCVIVQFVPSEQIVDHKPSLYGLVNKRHASYSTSGLSITVPELGTDTLKIVVTREVGSAATEAEHAEEHSTSK
jgi:hypothetical protein